MLDPLLPALAGLIIYLFLGARPLGFFSASSLFIYMQFLMLAGIASRLEPTSDVDSAHSSLLVWTFMVVVFVSVLGAAGIPEDSYSRKPVIVYPKLTRTVWILLLVSAAVSLLYFFALGFFPLLESLTIVAAGGDGDIAGIRLESYAGSRYLLPGYVNQFKNAILPSLALVVVTTLFHYRVRGRGLVAGALLIFVLLMVMGTAQRGALVMVALLSLVYVTYSHEKPPIKLMGMILGIGVAAFMFGSFALGRRREEVAASENLPQKLLVLWDELVDRMLSGNRGSATIGFRYIYEQPTQWGSDWLGSLVGLLPGRSYSGISSTIFSIAYGSTRGTAPPSLWGSAYYNWGFTGTLLFAAFYAAVCVRVSTYLRSISEATPLLLVGYAGVSVVLGTWIAGTPTFLLNTGIGAYMLLWWLGARQLKSLVEKRSVEPSQPREKASIPTQHEGATAHGGSRETPWTH